jgi:hypothetical protein
MPFVTTGLAALYSWNLEDDGDDAWWSEPDRHAPAGIYLDVEGIEDFLRAVGSADGIAIATARVFQNPELKREWWVNYRHSAYTVTRDWQINELAEIVETGDPTLLRTLWSTVLTRTSPWPRRSTKLTAVPGATSSGRNWPNN